MTAKDHIILTTLNLNNTLFRNAFIDVTQAEAHRQVLANFNPMIFIAGHMVNARFYLAKLAGLVSKRPLQDSFMNYDPQADYGSPQDMLTLWDEIAETLGPKIAALSEEEMLTPRSSHFPVTPQLAVNNMVFLMQHEAYHLGQLGLIRKALGHPPLAYKPE